MIRSTYTYTTIGATLLVATALAVVPVLVTSRQVGLLLTVAIVAWVTLSLGLLLASPTVLRWALVLIAVEYILYLALAHASLGLGTVAEAVGFLLLAELAAWSLDARRVAFEDAQALRARALWQLTIVVGSLVVAVVILLIAELPAHASLATHIVGLICVLALVALGFWWFARSRLLQIGRQPNSDSDHDRVSQKTDWWFD